MIWDETIFNFFTPRALRFLRSEEKYMRSV